jgi:ABC-type polysaccharide/polyol phosphate export permease
MERAEGGVIALARRLGDLYRFRELVVMLVGRDLKVRYKRSILGMFWTLLNPLLQMAVFTFIFSTIMKVEIPGFPVFLLAGLLPWTLISVSTIGASVSLINNQGLIRKVAVPQAVYPLAVVASKLVDLVLSLVPLVVLALVLGRPPGFSWVFVPVALLFATAFSAGLALVFSTLTVFFRDIRHLIDILFQLWFYLTPVLYPVSFLDKLPDPWMKSVLLLNPAAYVVECFQASIYEGRFPDARLVGLAAISAAASLVLGLLVFLRGEERHIHYF